MPTKSTAKKSSSRSKSLQPTNKIKPKIKKKQTILLFKEKENGVVQPEKDVIKIELRRQNSTEKVKKPPKKRRKKVQPELVVSEQEQPERQSIQLKSSGLEKLRSTIEKSDKVQNQSLPIVRDATTIKESGKVPTKIKSRNQSVNEDKKDGARFEEYQFFPKKPQRRGSIDVSELAFIEQTKILMAQNLQENKIRKKKRRKKKSSTNAVSQTKLSETSDKAEVNDLRAVDSDVFQTVRKKSKSDMDNLTNKIEPASSKAEKMPETPVLPRKSASPVMKSKENKKNGLQINQKRKILPLISQKTTDSTPYRIQLKSSTSIESYDKYPVEKDPKQKNSSSDRNQDSPVFIPDTSNDLPISRCQSQDLTDFTKNKEEKALNTTTGKILTSVFKGITARSFKSANFLSFILFTKSI